MKRNCMKTYLKKLDGLLMLLAALCLAGGMATSQCGCRNLAPNGAYNGQKLLYDAETTITASYGLVNTFLTWETENRRLLAQNPGVTRAADKLRADFPRAYESANALRDAFIAAPSAGTDANLTKALTILRAAMMEAAKYMSQPL